MVPHCALCFVHTIEDLTVKNIVPWQKLPWTELQQIFVCGRLLKTKCRNSQELKWAICSTSILTNQWCPQGMNVIVLERDISVVDFGLSPISLG